MCRARKRYVECDNLSFTRITIEFEIEIEKTTLSSSTYLISQTETAACIVYLILILPPYSFFAMNK